MKEEGTITEPEVVNQPTEATNQPEVISQPTELTSQPDVISQPTETVNQPEVVQINQESKKAALLAKIKGGFEKITRMKYFKIGGIVLLAIIILIVLSTMFFGQKEPNYSLVFRNEDGDLMVINAKKQEADKITSVDGKSYEVVYANETEKKVLYTKDNTLYFLNVNKADEPEKIDKEVNEFAFSKNDKYVYYTNDDYDLYVYDYKTTARITKSIDMVVGTTATKIFYIKANNLYVSSLKASKDDSTKIESDVSGARISNDQSVVVFYNEDGELYSYKISNQKVEELVDEECQLLDSNDDYSAFIYSADEEVFYYKNGKSTKIADDVEITYFADVKTLQILYGEYSDDYSTADLYYKKGDKEAVKVANNIELGEAYIRNGDELYYSIGKTDDDYETTYILYYAKISGAKVKEAEKIASKVLSGLNRTFTKGCLFISGTNDDAKLQIAVKGKVEEVADDVSIYSSFVENRDHDLIYFISDYKDGEGKLYSYNGRKLKEISSDVYSFAYINDKLIYILKDYEVGSGSLYRFDGKNEIKVAKDVTDYSEPLIVSQY